jgi:nucleoside phosphorylase
MARIHTHRKEIARYLLSRGTEETSGVEGARAAHTPPRANVPLAFPSGLEPTPDDTPPERGPSDPLPEADVIVITWTVDEVAALASVLTPGVSSQVPKKLVRSKKRHWMPYDRKFSDYVSAIRSGAPARAAKRLASFYPLSIGGTRVLAMKSELHLNQDGVRTGKGTATLPVKDFFAQIIAEARPKVVLTAGTAGSVFDEFDLGDVVVTRGAQFMCADEFANEPFNHQTYTSNWKIPTEHFGVAEKLMAGFADDLAEPEVRAPSPGYQEQDEVIEPKPLTPQIRLDGDAMPKFHPILTTDYFEYGTTENRLDQHGAGVEMGDAALGLACSEMAHPPRWAVVRNMSDPVINGRLPKKQYHLNEQTTWAVGFYTGYGRYTSLNSSLAAWAIAAGL